MNVTRISPVRFIQVESAAMRQAQALVLAAGANITLTPVQSGARVTLTIASTGGSGTPAGSVVAETSFSGASSAVGASTDYARADHTHGTPADAPSDGSTYGRKDGAWSAVASGDVSTLLTAPSTIAANTCRYVAPNYTISTGDLTIVGDLVVGG